jgi:hypothetical protein
MRNSEQLVQYCDALRDVMREIRIHFRSGSFGMQDRYWRFQDLLLRLKAILCEDAELLVQLQSTYPKLIRESVALLEASDLLGFTRVSAIRRSCDAINRLLIDLEELKQRYRAKAASA